MLTLVEPAAPPPPARSGVRLLAERMLLVLAPPAVPRLVPWMSRVPRLARVIDAAFTVVFWAALGVAMRAAPPVKVSAPMASVVAATAFPRTSRTARFRAIGAASFSRLLLFAP